MPELRVRNIDESEIDTILAEDVDFDGEVSFKEPLLIKGKVTGHIRSEGDLFISEEAVLDATVEADTVSVKGRVTGDIRARSRLELFSSSRVSGNIHAPDLIVQSGCVLNGTCHMPETGETGGNEETAASGHE